MTIVPPRRIAAGGVLYATKREGGSRGGGRFPRTKYGAGKTAGPRTTRAPGERRTSRALPGPAKPTRTARPAKARGRAPPRAGGRGARRIGTAGRAADAG